MVVHPTAQPSLFDWRPSALEAPGLRVVQAPFDLTAGLEAAASVIARLAPELAAIRADEVLFTLYAARRTSCSYTLARCYPLPWEARRKARRWQKLTAHFTPSGARARYILAFSWPRFFTLAPRDRLETLVHELYHIGPAFDGQPRNCGGKGWHGRSHAWYDAQVRSMVARHLPPGLELSLPALARPLRDLRGAHGEHLALPTWWTVANADEPARSMSRAPRTRLSDPTPWLALPPATLGAPPNRS